MKASTDFITEIKGYKLWLRREDQFGEGITGNKYRKLKYNILQLKKNNNLTGLITFGGAFSNHLYATALAGKIHGIKTFGIVRGEEWRSKITDNPTLTNCLDYGMKLLFVSRNIYKQKHTSAFWDLINFSPKNLYIIPEGGTNDLAIKGTSEMLQEEDCKYESLCCPVGTGGTIAGILKNFNPKQKVIGFSSLNHQGLKKDVNKLIYPVQWELINDYTFGGYAKTKPELISFINNFKKKYSIQLDPIYTGKMLFGIFDKIKKGKWVWGKNILIFHTGGLQSIEGFNQRQYQKGLKCTLI
ncbi:MAG: pyridoxal-phosphate dependent enzyme [Flavobacteriaceae bacterium]|nr:pyridoxal-phosphate dependent enzyme [Flavobacteriaceae bacterium]